MVVLQKGDGGGKVRGRVTRSSLVSVERGSIEVTEGQPVR